MGLPKTGASFYCADIIGDHFIILTYISVLSLAPRSLCLATKNETQKGGSKTIQAVKKFVNKNHV